ncbi:MAG: hypothetical protein JXR05_01700 [Flavobacteriaceae bacterium]
MDEKIEKAIEYYTIKSQQILKSLNSNNNLTAEEVIENGEELSILEYKLTALEAAKSN